MFFIPSCIIFMKKKCINVHTLKKRIPFFFCPVRVCRGNVFRIIKLCKKKYIFTVPMEIVFDRNSAKVRYRNSKVGKNRAVLKPYINVKYITVQILIVKKSSCVNLSCMYLLSVHIYHQYFLKETRSSKKKCQFLSIKPNVFRAFI